MYTRVCDLKTLSLKKSLFLFGPRSTGKSTLLKKLFGTNRYINLLKSDIFLRLSERPVVIRDIIKEIVEHGPGDEGPIIIDEIQKLPILLDEVHDLIESQGIKFILTGSSARKLRRSGVNLLAGRAWQANLFPLVYAEIPEFNLEKYLLYGGLPQVYSSQSPEEELDAYLNIYLKEEIKEEALVQNFVNFSRFLKISALSNAKQINYSNISQETGVPVTTVRAYFEILSDTFVGFTLEPWHESKKRKAVSAAKFYFFDIGVANYLNGRKVINRNSDDFGEAFEHWMAMELRAYLSYQRIKEPLTYWRTTSKEEVDFIIGNKVAIEVKSTTKVLEKHLKGLKRLAEEGIIQCLFLVSFDEIETKTSDGVRTIHWKNFINDLWTGKIIS
ncbi:MAG: ATPase [Bdellovibrionales bacterium GWA2_49_15]|nr:MAG: ATPase [Bdellovibrionales bacterium GWA2_49_15]HAZ14241.1 ATPase [Bdellovibrionales bacterium]